MSSKPCAQLGQSRASKPLRKEVDPSSIEKLTLQYLPLVKSIARRVYLSLPAHAATDLSDLVQAGCVGLVNASASYRSDVRVPFATYARYRVRGEILDSLRKLDCASRNLRQWQKQMDAASRNLSTTLQREPTEEEISANLGLGVRQLRHKKLALRFASAYVNTPVDEADANRLEQPACAETRPDALQSARERRNVLDSALGTLPVRSRQVIHLYYSSDLTMKQIGERLSVNESRISQIHKCALQSMARALRLTGISSTADV